MHVNKRVLTCEGVRVLVCECAPQADGGRVSGRAAQTSQVWPGSTEETEGRAQTPWHGDGIVCQQGTRGGEPGKGGCQGRV